MFTEAFLLCVIAIWTFLLYKFVTVDRLYFKRRNIKYKGQSYALGGIYGFLSGRFTAAEFAERIYNAFQDERLYGVVDFSRWQYFMRDPEIIRKIGIKDFDYFEDHRGFIDETIDKLWGNSLFLMKGQKWRQMRATLSPAFTGSKMRQMFELVSECAVDVISYLKRRSENGNILNIEMKDLFSRYTNDVITSCAFGLKVDSLAEPNNEFYLSGINLSNFSNPRQMAKAVLFMLMPKIARMLKLQFVDPGRFMSLVLDTMEYRKKNNIFRPDMINIMMQIRDGSLKSQTDEKTIDEGFATVDESDVGKATVNRVWNDDEIVAQCFLFFIAGFETTSTILTFAAYELVANPDIQQRLYEEAAEMDKQLDGKRIGYDSLQKLKYMDQVVSEVLRKWPPLSQQDRVCVKDYTFDDGNGLKFNVEKDSVFVFSVYSIQNDPKYYPNPEIFDPERFSDENKDQIVPGTYLPFGIGPRNCIGSRFALMTIKAILYHLLLNFSFEPNEKTEIPLKLKKSPLFLMFRNGMHLQLKPRSH